MGRPRRGTSKTKVYPVRLDEDEQAIVDGLRQGQESSSTTIRRALVRSRVRELALEIALRHEPLHETEPLVTKEEMGRLVRKDQAGVEQFLFPAVDRLLVHHGMPYPPARETLDEAIKGLQSGKKRAGVGYLKSMFPSFWEAGEHGGAEGAFADEKKRHRVLAYRMGLNDSEEFFDINWKNIRRGFVVGRHTVSFFKPADAYAIYKKWLPDPTKRTGALTPRVWDPSAGFGARLLGFHAAFPQGIYDANDPARRTRADVEELMYRLGCEAHIIPAGSEVPRGKSWASMLRDGLYDLVFTSPPYFAKERYYDEAGQCWRDYPDLETWTLKYVRPTIEHAAKWTKPGAYVIFNVSEDLEALFSAEMKRAGLVHAATDTLTLQSDHFRRASGKTDAREEPVLVYRKPSS